MAALDANSFTVTVENVRIVGRQRRNRVKLVFGNGVDTYSVGGISLPSFSKLGFLRNVDYAHVIDSSGIPLTRYEIDKTALKLKAFMPQLVGGQAAGSAIQVLPDADAGVIGKTAATTRSNLTLNAECTATFAPASTSLWIEAVGW